MPPSGVECWREWVAPVSPINAPLAPHTGLSVASAFHWISSAEVLRAAVAIACIALMVYQWLAYRKTSTGAQLVFLSLIVAGFGLSSVWLAVSVVRFYTHGHESDGMGLWHLYVIRAQDILLWFIGALVVVVSVWAVSGWWIQRQLARWRLRELGFSTDDMKSEDAIFKKWGEIAAAKIIPQKITFNEIASHS